MTAAPRASDVAVVIPTRDRWAVLGRTLAALEQQTAGGFEVVVVADGEDQRPPDLPGTRVLTVRHGGPAWARNRGAATVSRDLLLFLGDDMVPAPDLVERHLDAHSAGDASTAVLGHVDWHPEVRRTPAIGWIDRTATQFDYAALAGRGGEDAGFGRFYSCNVSLRRGLFDAVGGFDPAFVYCYEDLDMGWRLAQAGMRLVYAPLALALHLHEHDWESVGRRFEAIALGERLMAAKHPWFEPWFRRRLAAAATTPPRLAVPVALAERLPAAGGARDAALRVADRAVDARLAPAFERDWARAGVLVELRDYLGGDYDAQQFVHHAAAVDTEASDAVDEAAHYRTSRAYLYDLTVFDMSGTKDPYRAELLRHVPPGGRLLDYGCGIGADGLRLAEMGYSVAFADFDNPSTDYLRWRLRRRDLAADVIDVERDELPRGFDAAFAFDVLEHVDDPFAVVRRLEEVAAVVCVNLLEPAAGETHLHHELPISALRERAERRGLLAERLLHGRSHLLVWRGDGPATARGPRGGAAPGLVSRLRSRS